MMFKTQEGQQQAAISAAPRAADGGSPSAVALRMRRYRERQKKDLGIVSAEVDILGLADFLKSEGYLPRGVTADFDALCAATSAYLADLLNRHYA
jgi:hypothetical protein